MTTILTHPANVQMIRSQLIPKGVFGQVDSLWGVEIRTSPYIDQHKHSGKYVLRDGTIIEKEAICFKERFVTYGPEDVDYLLYLGLITKQMEANFYLVNDTFLRFRFDTMPMIYQPKAILMSGSF